ncbi:hypothetical protein CMI37_14615 [Candidatus Pacearchaeota archaeon]|nr:hypothetical protein [Candidatus Pacearchaeota archaeon]|tara:strand:+ start:6077 stop:6481 length:405 start_codon:yes stop_codon:yes gene_type:complete
MRKSIISLTIDPEVWELAILRYPKKLSSMIEDYLKTILYSETQVKVDKLEEEKKQTMEQIAQAKEKLVQIRVLERKKEEEHKQKLEYTKEQEIERKKCVNCGNFLGIKQFRINKGLICYNCFSNTTPEQIKEWM